MITKNIPWPLAYAAFTLALTMIAYATYYVLRRLERKTFAK